jgi:eukaryotic-like serine/threonine-protein kinase
MSPLVECGISRSATSLTYANGVCLAVDSMRSSMHGYVGNPSIPERVGRYEILLPIGTGGMATVYLARTLVVDELYREVALKLMHPHLRTEDGMLTEQLVQEAKVAASIRHPNVVPVLEVADDVHGVYLVLEYIEGVTLSALIRAARAKNLRIPAGVAGRILIDALTGLHAAHELQTSDGGPAHLVHRDFSPQNLLVGTDGVSRLTDFGIAKVTSQVGVTAAGVIKGKVGYMSPEQALGKPLDRRCDVWASGVVAWELLAQQRLFNMDEEVAALLKIVSEPPPRIRSVRPDVPEAVDNALAWAMTQDVEQRCPTASDLRATLIQAWRAFGPLAEAPDVGAFVSEMAGEKLEQRRKQVLEVIELRREMSKCANRAIALNEPDSISMRSADESLIELSPMTDEAATSESEAPTIAEPAADLTTENSSTWARTSQERSWKPGKTPILAGAAVLATLTVVAGWWSMKEGPSEVDSSPATPPVATSSKIATSQTVSAPAQPSAAVPEVRSMLIIHANEPMSAVRVGKRSVGIVEPTLELDVRLATAEREAELEVLAKTSDGRRAVSKVAASAQSVTLEFPPRSVRPPPRPRPPATKKPPGLAPTPYEK